MTIEIRILLPDDEAVLATVAPGVFDNAIKLPWASEFLRDSRHHLAVAIESGLVVGFASAVHYIHPDKSPELWINEVGVAPTHRNQGLGQNLLKALFEVGREVGCSEAWVLTERSNVAALRLYQSVGGTVGPDEPVAFSFRLDPGPPN